MGLANQKRKSVLLIAKQKTKPSDDGEEQFFIVYRSKFCFSQFLFIIYLLKHEQSIL
jgi:hypothetical protein